PARKIPTTNSMVYHSTDSPKFKSNSVSAQPKISSPLKGETKTIHQKIFKSPSLNNIHSPRKIREKEIMSHMTRYFPDKTISVEFVAFNRLDAEAISVKNRIIEILRKNGYKNIDKKFHVKTNAIIPEKIVLDTVSGKHSICFSIPPVN
ncbi:MAG TPA: hypothetical protein VFE04_08295, partial [Puia sp.]|nr:hypothetical protein [Puia sp.]